MSTALRPTGIPAMGDLPWGMHICLFYETETDLLDTVVPYFTAGLAAGERCAWVPSEPSLEEAAVIALRERVPDYDARVAQGDVRFLNPHEFYITNGRIDIDAIIAAWAGWDAEVRDQGRMGLRVSGDVSWLQPADRPIFAEYERRLQEFMRARRILTLCTYPLASVDASNVLDSGRTHHSVIARRRGTWQILEEATLSATKAELEKNNAALEARVRERTNELLAANAALSRTEMYLEQAQSLSHTGSCGWDPQTGEYTYWSKETFRVFGLEPRSTPPPRQEVLVTIHPKDRIRFQEAIAAMTREGRAGEVEFRITRPDGSVRYIHEVARPIKDDEGRVVEFIASEMDVTELKRAAARLARATRLSHERTLQARFSAMLDERTRLAREIHDSLLQGATGIALHLRAVLRKLDDVPPSTRDEITRIVELTESMIRDARQAVWDMRPAELLQKGLAPALQDEASRALEGTPLGFNVHGAPRPLSPVVEDTIFHVGREAVVNAARHAAATHVVIDLEYRPRFVRLTVRDDGRGFDVDLAHRSAGGRLGLLGMRERAERIGASLTIRSAEGRGTIVELRVPNVSPNASPARRRPRTGS